MASPARAREPESPVPHVQVPAKAGERCTVCGVVLGEDDVALIVKGRRFPLDRSMVDVFLKNPEEYFRFKQVKSALFQEEMRAPAGSAQAGIGWGWFLAGLYVLSSLLFGGLAGYVGVARGLSSITCFFAGFFLNALGLIYILMRPPLLKAGDVPPGFVKVPLTHDPVACPACGNTNHPAAARCAACGASLVPKLQSEVARTR